MRVVAEWFERCIACAALAAVAVVAACDSPTENPADPVPPEIEVLAGNQQTGRVGAVLQEPLLIRVLDDRGGPAVGVPVRWEGDENALDEPVVDADSITDENGQARANWQLGRVAGEQHLQVHAGEDLGSEFLATATPADPLWIDLDVEADGSNVFGRHSLTLRSYDRWGNETEPGSVAPTWTSSDSTVAYIDDDEIVIGSEGIARIPASGVASGQEPHVSVHVRDGKAFLMNGWTYWLPPVTRADPGAEGRPNRIVAQGTAIGPDGGTTIRQGFWEPMDGGFGVQALTVRESSFGWGSPIYAGFRGVLFPVDPGDYVVGIMEGYDREGEEPLPFESAWTFEATVPD